MLESLPDAFSLSLVLIGAFVGGFVTGFAGFGMGLVSAGLWFHALPAPMVPPLVALASVAAQIVGIVTVRKAFAWRRVMPYLIGGLAGVPFGVAALKYATPEVLRLSVGGFLFAYAAFQLSGIAKLSIGAWGGRPSDGVVGAGGGFLGGFSGLSGPLPLVWLQMRGGPSAEQRAIYQPFNLIVLAVASAGMSISGAIDRGVLTVSALCLPVILIGAWLGARVYTGVSEEVFRRIVLFLLLVSGLILIAQGVA